MGGELFKVAGHSLLFFNSLFFVVFRKDKKHEDLDVNDKARTDGTDPGDYIVA